MIDLGLCSTPLVSFAVRELGADGGLSITGSHNDAAWNALKFIGPDGALLNPVKSEELLDIYHASALPPGASGRQLRPVTDGLDLREPLPRAPAGGAGRGGDPRAAASRWRSICATARWARWPRRYLDALGCSLSALNEEPTGRFAHPPAPSAANLQELAAETRRLRRRPGRRASTSTATGSGL